MKNDSCRNRTIGRASTFSWVFCAVFSLAALLLPSPGRAASSGPGTWNFLIYGNYDLVSPNSGGAVANLSSGATSPPWNKFFNNNGYGGGVGAAYWFTDVVAVRAMAQTDLFSTPSSYGGGSTQSSAVTGGLELKLLGDADYYLYAVVDAGGAFEANMPGQSFYGKTTASSWTTYGDAGLGLNLAWVFVEGKIAYMPQALAGGVSGGYGQNALWYVPLTAGFNF